MPQHLRISFLCVNKKKFRDWNILFIDLECDLRFLQLRLRLWIDKRQIHWICLKRERKKNKKGKYKKMGLIIHEKPVALVEKSFLIILKNCGLRNANWEMEITRAVEQI